MSTTGCSRIPGSPRLFSSRALAAIDRILSPPSMLMELWDEGEVNGINAEWRVVMADLRARVAG